MWKRPDNEPSPTPAGTNSSLSSGPAPSPRPAAARGEVASIGPSITVKGDISGEEDLLVQGQVEGTIDLKRNHVTVGKHGRVKADIHGRVIDVQGEVEGNLLGDEQVVVRQSGAVRGNITAPRVSLEDGANFKGTIDMEPKGPRGQAGAAGKPADRGGASAQGGTSAQGGSLGSGKSEGDKPGGAPGAGAQKPLPTGAAAKPGAGNAGG